MKFLLMLLFAVLGVPAGAAPFLLADPYPTSGPQPDAASFTVNGGAPVACALESVAGGIRPKCDLASITAAGTYTLVMTVSRAASIVNGTNTATNTAASSASAAPFAYVLSVAAIGSPASARVSP